MNPQQQQPKLNIDLKNTKSIETPEGNKIFQQGVLLRSVSKFVVGAEEDAVLPVPIAHVGSYARVSFNLELSLRFVLNISKGTCSYESKLNMTSKSEFKIISSLLLICSFDSLKFDLLSE